MRPNSGLMMLSGLLSPVWNAADKAADLTVNAAGNIVTRGAANNNAFESIRGTAGCNSGKCYFEITLAGSANAGAGIAPASMSLSQYPGQSVGASVFPSSTTVFYNATTGASKVPSASGTVIYGVHFDISNLLIYFSANGAFASGVNPATPSGGLTMPSGTYFPAAELYATGENATLNTRGPFTYAPAAGYSSWGG